MSHSTHGRARRFVIDTLIAVASLTVVVTLVVAIDSSSGDQVARALKKGATSGSVAVQAREDGMTLMRTAMDKAQMHAPLTTFVGVSVVLMLFMLRMK